MKHEYTDLLGMSDTQTSKKKHESAYVLKMKQMGIAIHVMRAFYRLLFDQMPLNAFKSNMKVFTDQQRSKLVIQLGQFA